MKAAIEDLLRQKFSCDNIMVQSADEYYCHQQNKVSMLKANVSTYFAEERVEQFYSYLRTEQISIFGGSVNVSIDDGTSTLAAPQSGSSMVYASAHVFIAVTIAVTILLFLVTVLFIVTTTTVIKKFRNKSLKFV